MAHEPPPVDALMELLSRMRAESERNAAAIEALEKAHADGAGRLAHRFEAIKRLEAEVEEIECKSLDSAGNARASSEVLAAEQREREMLDAEADRIAAELAASTDTLEAMQMRSAEAASEVAAELPLLRCAFRKRLRDGLSSAMRLGCALDVLEGEAFGPEGGKHARGDQRIT